MTDAPDSMAAIVRDLAGLHGGSHLDYRPALQEVIDLHKRAQAIMALPDDGCGAPQSARRGDWMQTFTGRQYWPLDPRSEDVCIEDIAHHLSIINRYCGASRVPWSVGEHSLGVLEAFDAWLDSQSWSQRANDEHWRSYRRAVFLHDAPEAYCNDVVRPVKRHLPGYAQVEQANADAIAVALDLPTLNALLGSKLKEADNAMLLAEQAVFMGPPPAEWAPITVPDVMRRAADRFVLRYGGRPLTHDQVEAAFFAKWRELAA